jgi:phosphatidylglycerophosphate synthase
MVFAAMAGAAFWLSADMTEPARSLCLIVAAVGIQLRLLCNLFDGMVAIEGGAQTPTGAFWNEAPDRVSDILILVGMGLGAGAPALGWAAAALAVLTAYVRELGATAGQDPDFCGPMAKPHRMAAATLAALAAVLTAALDYEVDSLEAGLWLIAIGAAFTALRRSARLLSNLQRNSD